MAFLKALFSCLVVALVLFSACEAREFVVGNEKSWKIPNDPNNSYNTWASRQRFLHGDHLVFKYDGKTDSVVEVNLDGYTKCIAQKPYALKSFNDGDTKVQLEGEGPLYFISGNTENCEKGEKLEVMLLQDHHHGHHGSHISPAPSPSTTTQAPAPAPAPANGGSSLKNGLLCSAAVVLGLGLWL